MNSKLNKAILDAALLLPLLPHRRQSVEEARLRFARFRDSHPDIEAELVAHLMPASMDADFDILLRQPSSGMLSLSWRPENGIPWTPQYADHWAANFVLTVNGIGTTIQSALIYLNSVLKGRLNLMEDLVSRALLSAAIEEFPPEVRETDIDHAVIAFRRNQGLHSAIATQKWLDEMQLTMADLRELLTQNVKIAQFRKELTAPHVRSYFKAHLSEFDRISVLEIGGLTRSAARKLADKWRTNGICPLFEVNWTDTVDPRGNVKTFFASELPKEFVGVELRAVHGPLSHGTAFRVTQVLRHQSARLDQITRAKVEEILFGRWLAEQRENASVRWHWV
jgi:putative peptide maturation system protein